MSDQVFACLQAAVTIARNRQVPKVASLKLRLAEHGYDDETIKQAIDLWLNYEKENHARTQGST